MAERTMTTPETESYLAEPHVATVVTLNVDGSPHVAPVWYAYVEGRFYVTTGGSSVKVRNVGRDPRVALCIANDTSPARYVLVDGTAHVTGDDVERVTREVYIRYQSQERGSRNAEEDLASGDTVLLIVEPSKVISWVSGIDG